MPPAESSIRDDPEFRALCALSAELGRNPLRTQAAGGNTSLKRDGTLWIKASGTWLADAERRDIMVPVPLDALRSGKAASPAAGSGLRPSVETPVHAVIPGDVVVHIHCVATLALAVRKDAEAQLAARLAGLEGVRFAFLPYIHPGLPLADAIAALTGKPNVIVLGNHGLVVAAATVVEARALVVRVCAALEAPRRRGGLADRAGLQRLAAGSAYRLPYDPLAHDVATDAHSLAIARRGTLYPDHVVFLGSGVFVAAGGESATTAAQRLAGAGQALPPMLVFPGRGVLLRRDVPHGADDLARALAEVTAHIPPDTAVNCLTAAEEAALTNWDAEAYRLSLARVQSDAGGTPDGN